MGDHGYAELYGGLVVDNKPAVMDENESKARPRRAGRKPTPKSDDDSKKGGKRGRPRVDPQDQSAVERRRTQIRLAQRAYRERKETSISALEQRVAELQKTINEMSQTFLNYNDKAISSGIIARYPELGEELRLTMERFLELAKSANVPSDDEEDPPSPKKSRRKSKKDSQPDMLSRSLPSRSLSSSAPETLPQTVHPSDMLGYMVTYEHESIPIPPQESNPLDILNQRTFEMDDDRISGWVNNRTQIQQYRAEIPDAPFFMQKQATMNPLADKSLNRNYTNYTYSFQETSFARRLLRSSYERTYHLLTNPNSNPQDVQHLLRYTLCHSDPKNIADRVRMILTRSKSESLENWDMPLLHIGGAGLHFPRPETENSEALPRNWADPFSMGPYRPKRDGVNTSDAGYPLNLIDFAGLEGIWFDSNDVEQYLKTKGLHLDGSSSLAEIEVDESVVPSAVDDFTAESPSNSSHSSSSMTEPVSPANPNDLALDPFATIPGYFFNGMDIDTDLPVNNTGMNFDFNFDVTEVGSKTEDVFSLAETNAFPTLPSMDSTTRARKRKLIIDVDNLLQALNKKAVCLGRSPGYRQEDVDSALNAVVQDAI